MKKLKLFSALLIVNSALSIINCKAAVLLVDNKLPSSTPYSQINAAIAVANAGDTIYVNGSNTNYSDCIITKSITLIGAGTFSQKQNASPSSLNGIYLNDNVSNVNIFGFKLDIITMSSKTNVNNLKIAYNYINNVNGAALTNSSNIQILSNIFIANGAFSIAFNSSSNVSNLTIENNIMSAPLQGVNVNNTVIQNNVFYNCIGGSVVNNLGLNNASFINNIFYNSHPTNNSVNCNYLNNISYSTSNTYPTLGASNIDNTDPQFVNVAPSGAYFSTYNFNLQTTSPAHNAGTDGKDMGAYGGSAIVSLSGETYNVPVIRQLILLNSNVAPNGNVNVKVLSTKARTN